MSNIHATRTALIARILEGDGASSRAQRRAAFDNAGVSEALRGLIDKTARRAHSVTDHDFAVALASDLSEDQVFELVVCAAVGQASRQYDAARAALEAASAKDAKR